MVFPDHTHLLFLEQIKEEQSVVVCIQIHVLSFLTEHIL